MTRTERQALYDAARRYLGDVQLSPSSTEADITAATAAVKTAEERLRGKPHSLLGITRKQAT